MVLLFLFSLLLQLAIPGIMMLNILPDLDDTQQRFLSEMIKYKALTEE